jgi:5'-nucleotidase
MVTLRDLLEVFPYDDPIIRFEITGKQVKQVFSHIMRPDNRNEEGECFQVNKEVSAVYDDETKTLTSLTLKGKAVSDDAPYTICIQEYHYKNSEANLSLTEAELLARGKNKVVTTSAKQVIEEFLRNHQNTSSRLSGRLIYLD